MSETFLPASPALAPCTLLSRGEIDASRYFEIQRDGFSGRIWLWEMWYQDVSHADGSYYMSSICTPIHPSGIHSTEFEVGYAGSGPSELALCILASYFSEDIRLQHDVHKGSNAWSLHHQFKTRFLEGLKLENGQHKTITRAEIADFFLGPLWANYVHCYTHLLSQRKTNSSK